MSVSEVSSRQHLYDLPGVVNCLFHTCSPQHPWKLVYFFSVAKHQCGIHCHISTLEVLKQHLLTIVYLLIYLLLLRD